MIGRFPWDPFPAGSPDPKGPDPLHGALYRAAVGGADAYRAVRQVLRRERGVLRIGNRFVPDGRYRQVGFVALGHAAASMGLAALDALGEQLTQGFVAGPDAPPDYLPFRSTIVKDGWGPDRSARVVLDATRSIAAELTDRDLLLVLISPGASRSLLEPPASMTAEELGRRLRELHEAGATGPEIGTIVRALGGGGVAGRLLPSTTRCDVQSLLVDRGEGPALSGGGPTVPVSPAESARAREILARTGFGRDAGISVGPPDDRPEGSDAPTRGGPRPVVVAGPSDALRAAADLAFDKGWTSRVGDLLLTGPPTASLDRLFERVEAELPEARRQPAGRSKGLVVLSMATLDLPDGAPEESACRQFLERARAGLRRRELSVGLYRTAGPLGTDPQVADPRVFSGAVVGRPTDPDSLALAGETRALRMRPGITDVGTLAVAVVLPAADGADPKA